MGLAVIPTDWTEGYIELCVQWPNSEQWLAVLRGQLTDPNNAEFWDKFTGDPDEPKVAIEPTFDQNLHMEECMFIPSGFCAWHAGLAVPSGWLIRDGAAVSRAIYADLFIAIGTVWGMGDGSTTFNVPDARGRVDVGFDVSQTEFDEISEYGGSKTITLTTDQIPSHNHTQNSHNHTQNSHNHTQDVHNHTQNSHNHTVDGLVNTLIGTARRSLSVVNSGDNNVSTRDTTPTNVAATATNQATTPTNVAATATNIAAGGGASHSNLQPYGVYIPIIKV